jgi:hypothetical protein
MVFFSKDISKDKIFLVGFEGVGVHDRLSQPMAIQSEHDLRDKLTKTKAMYLTIGQLFIQWTAIQWIKLVVQKQRQWLASYTLIKFCPVDNSRDSLELHKILITCIHLNDNIISYPPNPSFYILIVVHKLQGLSEVFRLLF